MGQKRVLRQLAHSGRKCAWLIVAANPWYIIVRKMTIADLGDQYPEANSIFVPEERLWAEESSRSLAPLGSLSSCVECFTLLDEPWNYPSFPGRVPSG